MASCAITAQEFIQNTFSPTIAVLCSPDVENVCRKNNLSFVELIQPFCRMNTEVFLRDPQNQPFAVRNLRIVLKDMTWQFPSPQTSKKLLNHSVSNCFPGPNECHHATTVNVNGNTVSLNGSTPWFEAYRECFLRITPPSHHEFIGQYVACILVASTGDSDPLEELRGLSQKQHENQHQSASKTHRWFSPNTFKYHVLLHDLADGNLDRAQVLYGTMENTYGPHASHLLKINSRPTQPDAGPATEADGSQMPDPWSQFMTAELDDSYGSEGSRTASDTPAEEPEGKPKEEDPLVHHPLSEYLTEKEVQVADTVQDEDTRSRVVDRSLNTHGVCLTVSDIDRLRIFVHEFCVRGLLPYVERQMRVLGEAVTNRKGIPRSIFSATKKWFGGSKPTVPYMAAQANIVVYGPEALELQVRRLGDLAFMFQHHELAYQAYHMAKRDFTNDMAWLHCAGAQEMAAVSVFMLGSSSPRQFPAHYLDTGIVMYLNTCKSAQFATRCTLLSTECLKSLGRHTEAAGHFVRLTSEDSDLRSALLLEQAAHCYANLPNPHMRKYAFYLVLAAHRYNKAGQRKHSLRTYKMAQQVFQDRGWHLAQDHVNLLTGRLNINLGLISEATDAYRHLLYEGSKQPADQQAFFVREFINTLNMSESTTLNRHYLPLPAILPQETQVLLGYHPKRIEPNEDIVTSSSCGFEDEDEEDAKWFQLERNLVSTAFNRSIPYVFRPAVQRLTARTDNSKKAIAFAAEPVSVQLVLKNPLEIPLILSDVHLIWTFKPEQGDDEVSNQRENCGEGSPIITDTLAEVTVESGLSAKVILSLFPTVTGELRITGVAYRLGIQQTANVDEGTVSVRGMQDLRVQGPKLIRQESPSTEKAYGCDFRLNLLVFPPMPRLGVNFHGFPSSVMCGELRQLRLQLTNHGSVNLGNLRVTSTTPELFVLGPSNLRQPPGSIYFEMTAECPTLWRSPNSSTALIDIFPPTASRSLEPGESRDMSLWIRGPEESGTRRLDLLFYYEDGSGNQRARHRVLRHSGPINVSGSVGFEAKAARSVGEDEGLVVTVDVTNRNNVLDNNMSTVSVIQISGVSDTFRIGPIVETSTVEAPVVGPKETIYLCVKAKKDTKLPEGNFLISNVPLEETEWDVTRTPCLDFYWRATQKPSMQSNEDEGDKVNVPTSDVGLGIVILWKAFVVDEKGESRTAFGQHHVRFEALDATVRSHRLPEATTPNPPIRFGNENPELKQIGTVFPPETLADLVRTTARGPSRIQHDFSTESECVVDVRLNVENRHQFDVQVTMDAVRITDGSKPGYNASGSTRTSAGSSFAWVGRSYTTLRVGPRETRGLLLRAAIFAPGVYNLSNIYVGARPADHPHIEAAAQKAPGPRMVVVENS